ncbi:MAG TPA: helix-turn-helix domain-containing protein [Gemmatimonadales bacterium]|nr:helix-turn-helix domain-containing protein [Gemmatimonadales bacterium]
MTAKEAAEYLRVHLQTVYQWHLEGKIPAERAGRSLRFRKSELDAWLKSPRVVG